MKQILEDGLWEKYDISFPEFTYTNLTKYPPLLIDQELNRNIDSLIHLGVYLIKQSITVEPEDSLRFKILLNDTTRAIIKIYQKCVLLETEDEYLRMVADRAAQCAAAFILNLVRRIIQRYFIVVSSELCDLNTQDTRNFLSLYANSLSGIDAELMEKVHKKKFNVYLTNDVFNFYIKTLQSIRKRMQSMLPVEKFNHLCLLVLQCAMKYKTNTTIAFWVYLVGAKRRKAPIRSRGMGTFKYMVRQFIAQHNTTMFDSFDENNDIADTNIIEPQQLIDEPIIEELGPDFWENPGYGGDSMIIFDTLTPLQRQILDYTVNHGITINKVASLVGITRPVCKKLYHNAIEAVRKEAGIIEEE